MADLTEPNYSKVLPWYYQAEDLYIFLHDKGTKRKVRREINVHLKKS